MAKTATKKRVTASKGKKAAPSRSMAEVKCVYCQGTGTDRWGLMSVLSKCQVCKGKGTVQIEEPYIKCPVCKGAGVERNKRLNCLACKGKGVVHIKEGTKTCPECGGAGKTGSVGLRKYCLKCHGTGKASA